MKLGIIQDWTEEGFRYAASKGLEAVEYCVNHNYNAQAFADKADQIRAWSEQYGVIVASIGRWGLVRVDADGVPIPSSVRDDEILIDAASAIGCPVYTCGCNWAENLSFLQNCQSAISYFKHLIAYAAGKNVRIAAFNCEWQSFVVKPEVWEIVLGALPAIICRKCATGATGSIISTSRAAAISAVSIMTIRRQVWTTCNGGLFSIFYTRRGITACCRSSRIPTSGQVRAVNGALILPSVISVRILCLKIMGQTLCRPTCRKEVLL